MGHFFTKFGGRNLFSLKPFLNKREKPRSNASRGRERERVGCLLPVTAVESASPLTSKLIVARLTLFHACSSGRPIFLTNRLMFLQATKNKIK